MSTEIAKSNLRKKLRLIRQDFVLQRLSNNFIDEAHFSRWLSPLVENRRVVAGYAALGGEVPITNIMAWAEESGSELALPYIANRDRPMEFRIWQTGGRLERATFGFEQPTKDMPRIDPDVILTPLVAFDALCNRLGQGAGHYDRVFARLPGALRIGIAWSTQAVERVPTDPWDIPLDAILTENDWLTNPNGRIK